MNMQITWTAEDDWELLHFQRQGLSFSQIGKRIGRTRSACAGRIFRLRNGKQQPAMTSKQALIFACLVSLAKAGSTIPDQQTISGRTGTHPETVRTALRYFEASGMMKLDPASNAYRVLGGYLLPLPKDAPAMPAPQKVKEGGPAKASKLFLDRIAEAHPERITPIPSNPRGSDVYAEAVL